MTARPKQRTSQAPFVWDRPEPKNRPTPSPLSRELIVRAAIAIADKEGLGSMSLRKVGASLDAGPMRLYGYMSTKEELLELMVDVVYGEMASSGGKRQNWRDALRSIAFRTRQATRKHKWFIDLLGGRPHLGPHALAYLEASLAALSGTAAFKDIDDVVQALRTVNAYVIGAIRIEASELRAELESGMNETEWQTMTFPYVSRMIATGRFPTLAKMVQDSTDLSANAVFDRGLDCVLDGIEARLRRRAPQRKRPVRR
jgi:AcrR family transcriptional regulator